jgi:hypothetical protein
MRRPARSESMMAISQSEVVYFGGKLQPHPRESNVVLDSDQDSTEGEDESVQKFGMFFGITPRCNLSILLLFFICINKLFDNSSCEQGD